MKRAIAAAEVDEVKDIRDKALAIETYAAHAENTEAERQACKIRIRTERLAGQLLAQMGKATNQHVPVTGGDRQNLADIGISKPQSLRWQKLAAIPAEEFEATFAQPSKPSTTGIIATHLRTNGVPAAALWFWSRLPDAVPMSQHQGLLSFSAS